MLGRVGLGSGSCVSLKDKLTQIDEQISDLNGMTRQEKIDNFLAPQNHINDVPVPVKKETLGRNWSVCPWRAPRKEVVESLSMCPGRAS